MEDQNAMIIGGLVIPLILLLVKEVFSWMSSKNLQQSDNKMHHISETVKVIQEKSDKIDSKIDSLLQTNKTMYDWHDKADEDGVKVWYVRRSLEEALQENVRAINIDRKSTRLNSSHVSESRMPSSA